MVHGPCAVDVHRRARARRRLALIGGLLDIFACGCDSAPMSRFTIAQLDLRTPRFVNPLFPKSMASCTGRLISRFALVHMAHFTQAEFEHVDGIGPTIASHRQSDTPSSRKVKL
jgi:hypothetical protein